MYYFPPIEFQNEIYKRTAEVECNMEKEIKMIIEDGIKNGEIKKDDSKKNIDIVLLHAAGIHAFSK
jgi:hypothetical protein